MPNIDSSANTSGVYSFSALNILGQPAGDIGEALGISDSGLVLVSSLGSPGIYPDGVDVNDVYNYRTGKFTALPNVPGAVAGSTLANGINSSGEVVGQYDAGGGDLLTFVLNHGVFTTLDPFGLGYSFATAVSNNGLVTGVSASLATDFGEGFVYDNGKYSAIVVGAAAPGQVTSPQSINDAGTVVGLYGPFGGLSNGFIDQHGVASTFSLPGWAITMPFGINNQGDVVGVVTNDGFAHSYGFVDDNGAVSILQVPGSSQTGAQAINDQGVVDGQYQAPDGTFQAFLAFPTHGHGYSLVAASNGGGASGHTAASALFGQFMAAATGGASAHGGFSFAPDTSVAVGFLSGALVGASERAMSGAQVRRMAA